MERFCVCKLPFGLREKVFLYLQNAFCVLARKAFEKATQAGDFGEMRIEVELVRSVPNATEEEEEEIADIAPPHFLLDESPHFMVLPS